MLLGAKAYISVSLPNPVDLNDFDCPKLGFLTMALRFDCKYSILRKFKSFLTISHTDDPLWTRYWGVMKNDKLNLWLYPSDEDVKE